MLDRINHNIYRFKYRYGKHLPLKTPVDVSLELSSYCNQHCGYCYHADPKSLPFTRGFMETGMALKIIEEASSLGVNSLKFNYRGESTLHPDFRFITSFAKGLAKGSTFIDRLTNSNFKFQTNREDIFQGLCNQTKVKVSFDSFNKEIFEKQRAGGIFELAVANVTKFYNYPLRKDTELVIQAVRTNLNKDEDFEGFKNKLWPSAKLSVRDVVEGRVNKDLSEMKVSERDASERQSCLQAHVRLIVHHNGRVSPCCPSIANDLIIGDVNTMSLKEVFNSVAARQLRKDLKSGKAFESNPCKGCSSFETYKGFKAPWNS